MPSLAEFSARVHAAANRNLVEIEALEAWLGEICEEKLGPKAQRSEREVKAAAWTHRVAQKAMLRAGSTQELSRAEAERLAETRPWVRRVLETGATPQRLRLLDSEKDELLTILDWLRAETGPPLSGDWTRISVKQGAEGHEQWILALQKTAKRQAEIANPLDGCEPLLRLERQPEFEGWSWVKVNTPEALNREGALMRHCVGSYAEDVAKDKRVIWSLRDPQGKPRITVETGRLPEAGERDSQALVIRQVKGFANAPFAAELIGPVNAFFTHFEQAGFKISAQTRDLEKAGYFPLPSELGAFALWPKGAPNNEAKAIAVVSLLGNPELPSSTRGELMVKACEFFAKLDLPQALRAAGPLLTPLALGDRFEKIAQIMLRQTGLVLGSGRLSGHVVDPANPSDQQLARNLLTVNFDNGSIAEGLASQLAQEARLLAQLGLTDQMSALCESGACLIGASFAVAADKEFLAHSIAAQMGQDAFADRAVWLSGEREASLARDIALRLAKEPAESISEMLSRARALVMCARLGYDEASEILYESIPESHRRAMTREAEEVIVKAGYLRLDSNSGASGLWNGYASLEYDKIWTRSERSRLAIAHWASAFDPDDFIDPLETLTRAFRSFSKLGHHQAALALCPLIASAIETQSGPDAVAEAMAGQGLPIPAEAVERSGHDFAAMERALALYMRGGQGDLALRFIAQAKDAWQKMPAPLNGPAAPALLFDRLAKSIQLATECSQLASASPRIARALTQDPTPESVGKELFSVPAFSALQEAVVEQGKEATLTGAFLISALGRALCSESVDPSLRRVSPELDTEARKAIARCLATPENCNLAPPQLEELIGSISARRSARDTPTLPMTPSRSRWMA